MEMSNVRELTAAELYQRTDLAQLDFQTTEEVPDLASVVGQPRAVEAIKFGVGIQRGGYNIFALGPAGTGKRTLMRQTFEGRAAGEPVPDDWCYVNNFGEQHKPKAIRLKAGRGATYRDDMDKLASSLNTALSAAFESEEYQARRQAIGQEFQEHQSEAFRELQEEAQKRDLALLRTPAGLAFAPVRDGDVVPAEELEKLSEKERQHL
jgi:hypothetical protein